MPSAVASGVEVYSVSFVDVFYPKLKKIELARFLFLESRFIDI
jgi:hypothetical protein